MISIQSYILWALGIAALGTEIYALVDAARYRPEAYLAADKRTKNFWMLVLVVAALVGFVLVRNVLSIFGVVAFVAAAVYLADVLPAVRSISGRGGGSGRQGPYGPW